MLNSFFKIYSDLVPECRGKILLLIMISLFFILAETLGIAFIIPVISLIVDFESAKSNFGLIGIYIDKHNIDYINSMFFALLIVAIVFFLKNIFIGYYFFKSNQIIQFIRYKISEKLYKNYLNSDYQDFTKKNSAFLLRNISRESEHVSVFIQFLTTIYSEILILLFLIAILLMTSFQTTIFASILFITVSLIYSSLFRKKLSKLGNEVIFNEGKSVQHTLQGLNNMKIVKLMGRQESFLNKYNFHSWQIFNLKTKARFLSNLPRPILEVLVILGLTIVLFVFIYKGISKEEMIFTLGVYGTVILRAIPAINRVLSSYHNSKFLEPSVKLISQELLKKDIKIKNENVSNVSEAKFHFEKALFKNISFKFNKKYIFKNLNFELIKNDVIGIIGESGSGKSTFADILMGLLKPSEGEIIINNDKNYSYSQHWPNLIGYVPQNFYLIDDTIKNNILFGLDSKSANESFLNEIIDKCDIKNFISSENSVISTIGENGNKLSHGQRQRIAIARALYLNPEILILDEATSALDTATENRILTTLKRFIGTKTILFISHRLSALEMCNKIFEIKNFQFNEVTK